jgi:hypothetical protein
MLDGIAHKPLDRLGSGQICQCRHRQAASER